jgi:hypothetical protein
MKNLLKIFCCLVIFLTLSFVPTKTLALTGPENPYSFSATSGAQSGSVTITWYDDSSAKQYNLLYGTDPSHYSFGVVKLPDVQNTANTFTVNYLTPGQTYYFTLIGITATTPQYAGPVAAVATAQNVSTQTVTNHLPEYGFTAQTGGTTGTVVLNWTDNDSADKYDIVYGKTPSSLVYGLEDMPSTHNTDNSYTVGALQAGQPYYFSLVAERNGSIVLWSNPVRAVAN